MGIHLSKRQKRIFNHVLFWVIIIFYFSILPVLINQRFMPYLLGNLVFIPFDMTATYFIIYFTIPRYLFTKKYVGLVFFIIVAYLFVYLTSYILNNYILPALNLPHYPGFNLGRIYNSTIAFTIIASTASFFKIFNHYKTVYFDKISLENKSLESELKIVKSQINPHFLFNTLNNAEELIFEDRDRASTYLFNLSKILQYMIYETNDEWIPLKREIEYLQDYLKLSAINYDEGFVSLDISGSPAGKIIPPMIFTPIIENCTKHSRKNTPIPGIVVKMRIVDESITLYTENYIKKGKDEEKLMHGLGLSNLRKRLQIVYKDKYYLHTKTMGEKYIVDLTIPVVGKEKMQSLKKS